MGSSACPRLGQVATPAATVATRAKGDTAMNQCAKWQVAGDKWQVTANNEQLATADFPLYVARY